MKRIVLPILIAGALAVPALPAQAQMYGGGNYASQPSRDYSSSKRMTPEQKREQEKQKKLAALRKEAIKLQKQDGGTLTPEHKAYLEARMAEINGQAGVQTAAAAPAAPIMPPEN